MDPLNYKVLVMVTCDEEPVPRLVGVCNYDLRVTQQRITGVHRELVHAINRNANQFDVALALWGEDAGLMCYVSFTPIAVSEMSVPDPASSAVARLPKSVNTCINVCMKDVHSVLYPLT